MKEFSLIIEYEQGNISEKNFLKLFSMLIKNGHAWILQGHYGRTAHDLIKNGIISKQGKINWQKVDELKNE